jgi:hypothetical protein
MTWIVLVIAILTTALALFQWAARLRLMGLAAMEFAAENSRTRNLNTGFAIFLWIVWAYLRH